MSKQTTPLRQRMIEDMTIRNMSVNTQKAYIRAVANFSKHFGESPDKLTFEDVRVYRLYLVSRGCRRRSRVFPRRSSGISPSAAAVIAVSAFAIESLLALAKARVS